MLLDAIPISLNGANMKEIAPPHSYIDFDDFRSTQDLANYVKQVTAKFWLYTVKKRDDIKTGMKKFFF